MNTINWRKQWKDHAKNFSKGLAHIPLKNTFFPLKPGPGFGDLSHPTTELMLQMLPDNLSGETVLDIGTGSGILAIAAKLLGAKKVLGIDIDPEAVEHARKNAKLNNLDIEFQTAKEPIKFEYFSFILMNMIFFEQKTVLETHQFETPNYWITSGILSSQREPYLSYMQSIKFKVFRSLEKEKWNSFLIQNEM